MFRQSDVDGDDEGELRECHSNCNSPLTYNDSEIDKKGNELIDKKASSFFLLSLIFFDLNDVEAMLAWPYAQLIPQY